MRSVQWCILGFFFLGVFRICLFTMLTVSDYIFCDLARASFSCRSASASTSSRMKRT